MPKSDSIPATDPSGAPTPDEMYSMWRAQRRAEEDAETLSDYERYRSSAMRMLFGEAA